MGKISQGLLLAKTIKAIKNYREAAAPLEKQMAARYLQDLMGQERGLFLKIGQFMGSSTRSINEFQQLVQQPQAVLSVEAFASLVESYLKRPIEDVFESISPLGVAASLAQVHQARLKTGELVAIKAQLPHVQEALEDQMALLGLLPNMGPAKKWGVDIDSYKQLFHRIFNLELDYVAEAQSQEQFVKALSGLSGVKAPKVHSQFTRNKLIVQEWIEGVRLSEFIQAATSDEKIKAAELLLDSFLYLFIHHKIMQADYNEGNVLFNRSAPGGLELGLIDYGSCFKFSEEFILALLKLLDVAFRQADDDPIHYFVALGFDEKKLQHLRQELPWITQILFEPFLEDRAYSLKWWQLDKRLGDLLGESKWWFRSAGGEEFFMLMKGISGLLMLIDHLDVRLDFRKILLKNMTGKLPQIMHYQPQIVAESSFAFSSLAREIQIRVYENTQQKVAVTLPGRALPDLASYIDDDIKMKIEQKDISIIEIIKKSIQSGAKPGPLFDVSIDNKRYLIELV